MIDIQFISQLLDQIFLQNYQFQNINWVVDINAAKTIRGKLSCVMFLDFKVSIPLKFIKILFI